jgi:hypothetical protein
VETRARHFALGGGSTGICREGLAALLGGLTSDVRFVMLRARAALLHAENIDRCEVHRAVHKAMLALPEGQRRTACRLSCVQAAGEACQALGVALPTALTGRKEWRATVKAATRRLAARRLELRSSLTLFRTCAPTADWLRRWVWEMPATRQAPSAFLVSLLGGFCRLLPVTRLGRFAHGEQHRPHFCDFCGNQLIGDADAPHIFLSCPAWARWARQWLTEVDLAFRRTPAACGAATWWQRLRRGPPSNATLAAALMAAGCPRMPAGVLNVLRTNLTQAFVRTVGTWAARRVEWIDSLPPARRAAADGGGAQLVRAVTTQQRNRGGSDEATLRRASTAPPAVTRH